jgi:hypothetical protein
MERPPETLKSLANRIARIATSKDGAQLTRLLRATGLLGQDQSGTSIESNREKWSAAAISDPDRFGIWERKIENGKSYFVRRMDMIIEWYYWASLGRIEPKGNRKRVLLIGESVARGYLYDPQYTPAMALEKLLQARLGESEVEVIDLARTNLDVEVKELAISALMLEPDLAIIFAGNNWQVQFPPDASHIPYVDAVLRDEGMSGLKRYAEDMNEKRVRQLVKDVSLVYESKNVPLIWIVPEFNLDDWRDPMTNAPHLAEGLNREWINHYEMAQSALRDDDLNLAAAEAKKMVEIDQGVNVVGLYILAECSQRMNDLDVARQYLEQAKDALVWDPSKHVSPRAYSVCKATLLDEASKYKNEIINMPKLLKEYLKGGIPGRSLFLDYCHHSAEGIQIAMSAAASCVLRTLKGVEVPWTSLMKECIAPTREEEAEVSFLAAIHNAHWWQSYDLVHYYCQRAVQLSPHVAKLMMHYIDLQSRRTTPMLMCAAAEKIAETGSPLMKHYLLRFNKPQLDRRLLSAIVAALKEAGIDADEQLMRLRLEEHSVTRSDTDLLNYYYSSSADQPQEITWLIPARSGVRRKEGHYYKAYWLESKFIFIGEEGCPVSLSLTCRLPDLEPTEGVISIAVNGKRQVEIGISREWQTWDITVPGEAVRDGLNEVTINWPIPEFPGARALEDVINDLVKNKMPEFFTVFGEVHTFTVSDGRKVSTTAPAVQQEPATLGVQ